MFPSNRPNQYNTPKKKENPLQLKHGSYFWLSSILGTYTKEKYRVMQERLDSMKQQAEMEEINNNVD